GFRGRIGVFEAATASSEFVAGIARGNTEEELRQVVRSAKTPSLTYDGLLKVSDGITSLDEVTSMRWTMLGNEE
ncbi:MAG: hypothetical protein O2931_16705, partial [Planctomycetota bacterium]|nr:hypothetical protein [Planctomycetota bacterium]